MKAQVLDQRSENKSTCYLVKILLKDYIENLPKDYKDYDIQREIVANTYLDDLLSTIVNKTHIPPIVLILDGDFQVVENTLEFSSFKILDGLQRTFRLNAIWNTITLFIAELEKGDEILGLSKYQLSKQYSRILVEKDSNNKILQAIIHYYLESRNNPGFDLLDGFKDNFQWFLSGIT